MSKFNILDNGLTIKKISKTYGNKQVVRDISISINRNEIVGLLGPNGTGKTTLIKVLQGVFSPTTGRIKVGEHIKIKYFDQNKESIDLDSTPWKTMTESGDYVDFRGEKIHVLSYLKKFLFYFYLLIQSLMMSKQTLDKLKLKRQ